MIEIFRSDGFSPERHKFVLLQDNYYFWFSLNTLSINIHHKEEMTEINRIKISNEECIFKITSNLNTEYEITDIYYRIFKDVIDFDIPIDGEFFPRKNIINIIKNILPEEFI